ncbi:MAG TPA: NADP-dependent oxidoreductase [Thermoleophilaceae bacterium]|nr:NADP-dependent oxidoreductase [Thermoleophilaceae bacterium]
MKVIEVSEYGGPEVLRVGERDEPAPQSGQVVVRVRAANVNPTDLGARTGHGPRGVPDPPFVLGWDFAGDVEETGERVVGMIQWYDAEGSVGAYAEAIAVDPDWIVPLPEGLDYVDAATIPLNALTAVQGLELLALPDSTTLLVTGASGAVGGFAVQLAKQAGHRVIATASDGDEAWVSSLGADEVLPRDADLGSIEPVPAVFDAVPLGEPALAAVEDGGTVVSTRKVPDADPARGIRQEVFLIHHDRAELARLVDEVAQGRLRTRVDRTLPLAEAAEAHRLNEAGGLRGKVVLVP